MDKGDWLRYSSRLASAWSVQIERARETWHIGRKKSKKKKERRTKQNDSTLAQQSDLAIQLLKTAVTKKRRKIEVTSFDREGCWRRTCTHTLCTGGEAGQRTCDRVKRGGGGGEEEKTTTTKKKETNRGVTFRHRRRSPYEVHTQLHGTKKVILLLFKQWKEGGTKRKASAEDLAVLQWYSIVFVTISNTK